MYPTKKGGGGFSELYDPENGQYTDEEKSKYFDEEMANIVMRYVFGMQNTYDPRFPIFGFHSNDYCELYIKYRICKNYKDVNYNKIDNYLFKQLDKDDKSGFFKLNGYDKTKRDELYKQLIERTDFTKMEFDRLNEYGILVKTPTKLYSYSHRKDIIIWTIWIYKTDEWFHFVTVDLGRKWLIMIKEFSFVEVKEDKNFDTPKCVVKKGSKGYVVDIVKNSKGSIGYLVEIDNEVYDFKEEELQIIK